MAHSSSRTGGTKYTRPDVGEKAWELNSEEPGFAESGRRNRSREANAASDVASSCSSEGVAVTALGKPASSYALACEHNQGNGYEHHECL